MHFYPHKECLKKAGGLRRAARPLFAVLPAAYLLRRHIVPPEMADSQEGEHRRVDKSGEQEGREVQLHIRVVGPHPDAEKGIREGVPEPLGRDHQPGDAADQAKGHRWGKGPDHEAELELHRTHRHAAHGPAQ